MKIKLRGIYSTALAKLLLDKGHEIVDPSPSLKERLKRYSEGKPDVMIYDKEDKNGVTIHGEGAEEIAKTIMESLPDTIIRKYEVGDIYCGFIKDYSTKNRIIEVDLGGEEGILPLSEYWGFLKKGEKVLVQVKGKLDGKPLLSTKLRLFGNFAVLIKGGYTKVSKHIVDPDERQRLMRISNEMKLNEWGVLWKSMAAGRDEEELKEEIRRLSEREREIKKKFDEAEQAGMIEKGQVIYFLEFGALSKARLDEIRKKVTPTIIGHHFLKAGNYYLLAELAEELNADDEKVIEAVNRVLRREGPKVGSRYEIVHKKVADKDVVIKGTVIEAKEGRILIKRKIKSKVLDGLNVSASYAITEIRPSEWFITHKYYDEKDKLVGEYININTPVEAYPRFARYVDLEVDVIRIGNQAKITDKEKLDEHVQNGLLSESIAKKALHVAEMVIKNE